MSNFCKCKSYSHFFSKNISVYAIFYDQSFNDMLTNNIVSFEQLGPDREVLDSAHDCTVLLCREPFIVTVPFSQYDLNNVERDVKYQTIIIMRV